MDKHDWAQWVTAHNPSRRIQRVTLDRLYDLGTALEGLCLKHESSSSGAPSTSPVHHGVTLTALASAASLTVKQVRDLVGSMNDEPAWLRSLRPTLGRWHVARATTRGDGDSAAELLVTRVIAPRCDAVMLVADDGPAVRTIDCEMETDYGSAVGALIGRCSAGGLPTAYDVSSMLAPEEHPFLSSGLARFAFTVAPTAPCPRSAHVDPRSHDKGRPHSVRAALAGADRGVGFVLLDRSNSSVDVLSSYAASDGAVPFVARVGVPGPPRPLSASAVRQRLGEVFRRLEVVRTEPPAGDDLVLRHLHLRSVSPGPAAVHLTVLRGGLQAARADFSF